ncbi:hypothetical protein P43SY_005992 [Pythium insidiosum]|uniref:Ubiquitin-like domain-containing protein n=1 Tax=Pythium insidiosum TaxID=114742 RepID=A0AAD5LV04_PYTIN|nr:hypothetical protein P43SY_005992 [Pythium insidiosum]
MDIVNQSQNRALQLSSYLASMKSIIRALGHRRISVLISLHTLTTDLAGKLWYSNSIPEDWFLSAVDVLTTHLCNSDYWNVIGLDLKNEPADATWGDGSPKDFRIGAEHLMKQRRFAGGYVWSLNPESGYGYNPGKTEGQADKHILGYPTMVRVFLLASALATLAAAQTTSTPKLCTNTASVVLGSCGTACPSEQPCAQYPSDASTKCSSAARNKCEAADTSCTYQCIRAYNSARQTWNLFVKEPAASDTATNSSTPTDMFPVAPIEQISGYQIPADAKSVQITGYDNIDVPKGSIKNLLLDFNMFNNAKTVTTFLMKNCKLSDVPSDLGNMQNLKDLSLAKNTIVDMPSADSKISKALQNLERLDLSNNEVSKFNWLLASIQSLDLSDNKLTEFPSVIFNMTKLQKLVLTGNSIKSVSLTSSQLSFLKSLSAEKLDTHQIPFESMGLEEHTIVQQVAVGKLRPKVSETCPEVIRRLTHECLQFDPQLRPSAARWPDKRTMTSKDSSLLDGKPSRTPFIPRDVFRLLVRLEEQKTHDVDTEALERRFRVPEGYSKEETTEQRELLIARNSTPGPGTYEVPSSWLAPDKQPRPSAVFASVVPRTVAMETSGPHHPLSDAVHSALESPPPLGSFTRAERGLLSDLRHTQSEPALPSPSYPLPSGSQKIGSFGKAPRLDGQSSGTADLGPAAYDVGRLWDPSPISGRHIMTAPSAAVFSADRERLLHSGKASTSPSDPSDQREQDPFEWLRRLPEGDKRVQLLMSKLRVHSNRDTKARRQPSHVPVQTPSHPNDKIIDSLLRRDSAAAARQRASPQLTLLPSTGQRDDRITVSCRLPGGHVVSMRLFPTKTLRQLKRAITRRQTRFQHEHTFDLFLTPDGTRLSDPDATLQDNGIQHLAMLQLVPVTGGANPATSSSTHA